MSHISCVSHISHVSLSYLSCVSLTSLLCLSHVSLISLTSLSCLSTGVTEDLVLREDISKHTKRRRLLLCDRFTDADAEPFEPDENITIGAARRGGGERGGGPHFNQS